MNTTQDHKTELKQAYKALDRGDYATTLEMYTILAEQGVLSAQFNLATMYGRGRGVEQDLERAGNLMNLMKINK